MFKTNGIFMFKTNGIFMFKTNWIFLLVNLTEFIFLPSYNKAILLSLTGYALNSMYTKFGLFHF